MHPDIKIGEEYPHFTLEDQKKETVVFHEALKSAEHTMLVFYRGHW